MSFTDTLMLKVRKAIDDTLARFNPFTGDDPLIVPREALPAPENSPYAPAGAAFDARSLWGRPLQEGVPADGDAYLWDADAAAFVLGAAAGGGGGSGAGFLASLGGDQALSGGAVKVDLNTESHDLGGLYDTATAQWTPPAGPLAIKYRVVTSDNADGDPLVQIRRNGGIVYEREGGRYSRDGQGWSESTFIGMADEGDEFELFVTLDGATLTTDTYWSGMTGGGGGTGVVGGGGVPAPFVYLVDDDGVYLVDDDGAYLWEPL